MYNVTLGDQSQTLLFSRQNHGIKTELAKLATEVSTAEVADKGKHLAGDFSTISALERNLTILTAYRQTTAEAAILADSMQLALTNLDTISQDVSHAMILAGDTPEATSLQTAGEHARAMFDQAIAGLNTKAASRALFAGVDLAGTALADPETIMTAISTAAAGATTAADIRTAVSDWFNLPGGGFETLAYTGATAPMGAIPVAEGQQLTLSVSAQDPEIRGVLAALATAALLQDDTILAGDADQRGAVAVQAAQDLLTSQSQLTSVRAKIGDAQARIETIQAENATKSSAFELARAALIGADPYETATKLQDVQSQLETLYTLTARLSRLSLADYLS